MSTCEHDVETVARCRKCGDDSFPVRDEWADLDPIEALRADLAKAQAQCAELGSCLEDLVERDRPDIFGRAIAALASDGTSALAAVRLMQRLVKMVTPPKERPADLGLNRREKLALEVEKALAEAFGSGE